MDAEAEFSCLWLSWVSEYDPQAEVPPPWGDQALGPQRGSQSLLDAKLSQVLLKSCVQVGSG